MPKGKPTPAQGQLQLQLYDLRREAKLRQARDWYLRQFWPDSADDILRLAPQGSEENAYMRMVTSYWEQACALLNHGVLHEELFFETNGEFFTVWEHIRKVVPAIRQRYGNKYFFHNLESAAGRFENWLNRRSPGSVDAMRQFIQQMRPTATAKTG